MDSSYVGKFVSRVVFLKEVEEGVRETGHGLISF